MNEQRKCRRFALHLPLRVLRHDDGTISAPGETVNLGRGGVLFDTDADMEVGKPIEYVITLPAGPASLGGVSLRCLGSVLRMKERPPEASSANRQFAVAASVRRYEFVRAKV